MRAAASALRLALGVTALLGLAVSPSHAEKKPLPESNLALLDHAIAATARTLVARAPIPSGTKIAFQKMPEGTVSPTAERAVLGALTESKVEVMQVSPPSPTAAVATPVPSSAMPDSVLKGTIEQQNAWRRTHKSEAVYDSPGENPETPPAESDLPLMVVSVDESSVDYPRLFRSGLFGGLHVERRAIVTLSAKLMRPDTRAVYWVGQADTSFADYVRKSEVPLLEDAAIPETRGTVPQQSWQKMVEPVLVIGLIVGLVSLFYTNRP